MISSTERLNMGARATYVKVSENRSIANAIVKKLNREGIRSEELLDTALDMLKERYDTGVIEERLRKIYGDN